MSEYFPFYDSYKKAISKGSIGGKKKKEAVVEVLVVGEESCEVDWITDGYKVEEPSVSEEVKHYNKDNNNNDNKNKDENEYKDKDEKEENKTVSGFVPPSWSDVSGYIFDKGLNVSADKFMEYYTANGWMVGKQPMKDWRMTLRNWDKREKNGNKGKTGSKNKSGKGVNGNDHPRYGAEQSTNANQGASAQAAGNERYGSGLGDWQTREPGLPIGCLILLFCYFCIAFHSICSAWAAVCCWMDALVNGRSGLRGRDSTSFVCAPTTAMYTKPTGLSGVPPPGPATPVVLMP